MHQFSDKYKEKMNSKFGHVALWRGWLDGRFNAYMELRQLHRQLCGELEALTPAGRDLLLKMHREFYRSSFSESIDRVGVARLLKRERISDWDRKLLNSLVAAGWLQAERKANTSTRERITGRWVGRGARFVYTMSSLTGLVLVLVLQHPNQFPEFEAAGADEEWMPESSAPVKSKPVASKFGGHLPPPKDHRQIKAELKAKRKAEDWLR